MSIALFISLIPMGDWRAAYLPSIDIKIIELTNVDINIIDPPTPTFR